MPYRYTGGDRFPDLSQVHASTDLILIPVANMKFEPFSMTLWIWCPYCILGHMKTQKFGFVWALCVLEQGSAAELCPSPHVLKPLERWLWRWCCLCCSGKSAPSWVGLGF